MMSTALAYIALACQRDDISVSTARGQDTLQRKLSPKEVRANRAKQLTEQHY